MSSQTTPSESINRAGRVDHRVEETRVELSSSVSEPHNECRECGRELTSEQARVIGDNDGCVPQCDRCTDYHTVATAVKHTQTRGGL